MDRAESLQDSFRLAESIDLQSLVVKESQEKSGKNKKSQGESKRVTESRKVNGVRVKESQEESRIVK